MQAQQQDSIKSKNIDEVVVTTAQYKAQSINKSIYKVEVINEAQIRSMAANNVSEVLNQSLNMLIVPDSKSGNSTANILGLGGDYVKVLIDNIPVVGDTGLGSNKDDQLRDLTFWNMGSLAAATWTKNLVLFVVLIISYGVLLPKGKALNAMMLGEKDAEHLGVNVEKLKKQIVVITALMVGTCVAFSGTIGFVGLIVPYILRLIFKSNYVLILPLSAIFGAVLLLIADTIIGDWFQGAGFQCFSVL